MTRFIVFASGKGGVGKTTVATNLSAALHSIGKDVILVDGNLTTPNVSVMTNMRDPPVSLFDVIAGNAETEEAIYKHKSGLRVLPAGLSIDEIKKDKNRRIAHILNDLTGKADYVLIDCAAGLGEEAEEAMKASDELVLVTNPEIHALTDCLKTFEFAKDIGIEPLGVILNRASDQKHEMSKDNVETFIELPVLGVVPEDQKVREAISKKKPVVFEHPKSSSSIAMKRVAAKISGEDPTQFREGMLTKLRRAFGF